MGNALHGEVISRRFVGSAVCGAMALAVVIVIAAVTLVRPQPASADSDKEAKALYKKAVALAKNGKYEEAIERFEEARTRGAPDETLFNIGKCYEALGLFYVAVQYYDKYLQSPAAKKTEDVKATIEELKLKPSPLNFSSDPPGAEVRQVLADGTESTMGVTPFEYLAPAGEFRFAVHKEGFESKEVSIEAGFGKPFDLKITLGGQEVEVQVVEPSAGSKRSKSSSFPGLGLAVELGGGVALHPHQGVDFSASGVLAIGIAWRFSLGIESGFAVGLRLDLKSLDFTGVEHVSGDAGSWDGRLVDLLIVPSYQHRLHDRLSLEASIPLGLAFMVPPGGMPETVRVDLIGGYIEDGETLTLLDIGVGLGLRIRVASGLFFVVEPVRLHVLVPFKKWPSGTGAIVDLDLTARLGFQF